MSFELFPQRFPTNCTGCHLKFDVPWVVDQLQYSMGCVVTESIAMFVYSGISTSALSVTFSVISKEFWEYGRVEDKALGFLVGFGVLFLGEGDDLEP